MIRHTGISVVIVVVCEKSAVCSRLGLVDEVLIFEFF